MIRASVCVILVSMWMILVSMCIGLVSMYNFPCPHVSATVTSMWLQCQHVQVNTLTAFLNPCVTFVSMYFHFLTACMWEHSVSSFSVYMYILCLLAHLHVHPALPVGASLLTNKPWKRQKQNAHSCTLQKQEQQA